MTRREFIMNATADLRAQFAEAQKALRDIEAELNADENMTYARLVRLSDRCWDASARMHMVARKLDAACSAAAKACPA